MLSVSKSSRCLASSGLAQPLLVRGPGGRREEHVCARLAFSCTETGTYGEEKGRIVVVQCAVRHSLRGVPSENSLSMRGSCRKVGRHHEFPTVLLQTEHQPP